MAERIPEAALVRAEHGPSPQAGGWYVLGMPDAEWRHADGRGAVCVVADDVEGWRRERDQLGVNPFVLLPGEPMALFRWAARPGAAVAEDTTDGDVAYESVPPREPTACRAGWLAGDRT